MSETTFSTFMIKVNHFYHKSRKKHFHDRSVTFRKHTITYSTVSS